MAASARKMRRSQRDASIPGRSRPDRVEHSAPQRGRSSMSTVPDTPEGPEGGPPALYTRGQALGRMASITAGGVAGPTPFGALPSEALSPGHPPSAFPPKFPQFKPFNPHGPAGPPPRVPKMLG